MPDELPMIAFASAAALEEWLAAEHGTAPGVWLKLAKRDSGIASVTYAEALDVALAYGWIDGQRGRVDATWYRQRFTPRRARSRWSRINRDKALALIDAGRMQPAGMREVERAQADGRWDAAYASQRTMTVPEDLQAALDADAAASAYFAQLDGANRYAVLYRVQDAKRPETRARRIEQYVAMLAAGEKLYP